MTLAATGNMRGELRVEVWQAREPSPAAPVATCSGAPTPFTGTQTVHGCSFSADGLTVGTFTHYYLYLKVFWTGTPLIQEPRPGEGVTTMSPV